MSELRLEVLKEWRAQELRKLCAGDGRIVEQFNAERSKSLTARRLCRVLVKPVEQIEIEMGALDAALACRIGGRS